MGFGSFTSPANSPIVKGKFFSRLTSNPPPSPASSNSSATSSPTALTTPSSSLTALPMQAASNLKAPTVLKLAAASQKLSLSKPLSEQNENLSNRQLQDSESQGSSATSNRSSRSPTSRLPPSSAMDTIFEEDGPLGSKTSILNDSDSNNTNHSSRASTFAPRSNMQSENGNNALSGEGDNGKTIVDNDTNFEELTNFKHSHPNIEEEGTSISPPQSPVRISRRRGATLSIHTVEALAAAANQIQSSKDITSDEAPSSWGSQSLLRWQNSSTIEPSNSSLSLRSSSPLSYSRSKTLPVSQSVNSLRSREAAAEMTKSGHKPLSRTASVSSLDCVADGETISDDETEWLNRSTAITKLRRRSNENSELSNMDEDKETGLSGMLSEHLQRKMVSRPQSPLVSHQLKSPHRAQSLKVGRPPLETHTHTKYVVSRRKLAYSRSISEPATENKASSQTRDNSCSNSTSSRKSAILPEKDSQSSSRLENLRYCINSPLPKNTCYF